MIVPSILNSITACDLLIAADCANASRAEELLFHNGIKNPYSMKERARLNMPEMHRPDPH
jgi:hypothetical protein